MKDKVSYFTSRSLFCGIGISQILRLCGSSFWLSMLLGMLIGIVLIIITHKTKTSGICKYISNILIATLSLSILINMAHTLYLQDTPVFMLTLFSIIAIYISASSSMNSLYRASKILFVISLVFFFIKTFSLIPNIDISNLYPQGTKSMKSVIYGAILFGLIGTVPIMTSTKRESLNNDISNYIISSLAVFTTTFLIVTVLGVDVAIFYRYPEYIVLKRINLLNFIYNVDNIFSFSLIVDLIMTSTICIKNISSNHKGLTISTFTLFLMTVFISSSTKNLLYIYNGLPYILIFLLIIQLFFHKKANN